MKIKVKIPTPHERLEEHCKTLLKRARLHVKTYLPGMMEREAEPLGLKLIDGIYQSPKKKDAA